MTTLSHGELIITDVEATETILGSGKLLKLKVSDPDVDFTTYSIVEASTKKVNGQVVNITKDATYKSQEFGHGLSADQIHSALNFHDNSPEGEENELRILSAPYGWNTLNVKDTQPGARTTASNAPDISFETWFNSRTNVSGSNGVWM